MTTDRSLVLDLTSNPHQLDFYRRVVDDGVPNVGYIGGLGSGKTVGGTAVALTLLQRYPGIRGILTAPTFDQLAEGSLQTLLEWGQQYVLHHNRTEHKLTFSWSDGMYHSELLYRSTSEIDRIRSHEYGFAWMDEGARSPSSSLAVIRGRLRSRRGVPLRKDGRPDWHYPLILTTTPVGRNWVYKRFGPGNIDLPDAQRKRYAMITARTADNPHLPEDYVYEQEIAYRGQEQLRQQELEGVFVTFEGLVYEMFREEVHVMPDPIPWESPQVIRRVAGVDFGGGHPTAIGLHGQGASGRTHTYREKIWRNAVGLDQIGAYLSEVHALTPLDAVWCDPQNQTAIATLRAGGLPAGPLIVKGGTDQTSRAINDRGEGIRLCQMLLGQRRHTFNPECIEHINEMYEYLYVEGTDAQGNRVLTKTPSAHHADALDSWRYAMMGLSTNGQRRHNARNRRRRYMAAA